MVIPLRDDNPTRRPGVVTLLLIAANAWVFFVVQPAGFASFAASPADQTQAQCFLYQHALVPWELTHRRPVPSPELVAACQNRAIAVAASGGVLSSGGVGDPSGLTAFPHKNVFLAVLASMFLHANLLHLGGNMLFLWIFGNNVEDRLGPAGYLLFYLFTGVAAAVAHVATGPSSTEPVIGASGAIAGVMGAYLVWFPRARVLSVVPIFFFGILYLPAAVVLLVWLALQFLNPGTGVAWAAHVGGFATGAAIAWALRPRPRPVGWG